MQASNGPRASGDRIGKSADAKLAPVRDTGLCRKLLAMSIIAAAKSTPTTLAAALCGKSDAETARAAADIEDLFTVERLQLLDIQLEAFLDDAAPKVVDEAGDEALFLLVDGVEALGVVVKMIADLFFDRVCRLLSCQ